MSAGADSETTTTRAARNSRAGQLLRWHRRAGLGLAALFVIVVLSGVALNHAEDFGLRHRVIEAPWLYRWYGMAPEGNPVAFQAGDHWVAGLDRTLVVDSGGVVEFGPVIGAVAVDGMLAVAAADELALLTADGELVERVARGALPAGRIESLGVDPAGTRLVVRTDRGIHAADTTLAAWREVADPAVVRWSRPETPSGELEAGLLRAWRGEGLTLHRVLLDLHSGRFFGRVGAFVVDLAALGLLMLVLTGVGFAVASRRSGGRRE